MRLSRRKQRLGSDRFECDEFAALATVKLRRRVARGLANKLAKRDQLAVRARFKVGSDVLVAGLSLRQVPTGRSNRSARRAGLWWNTGYLSCGGRYTSPPGLNLKTPGFTALGNGNFLGFFLNDTNYTDWVAYQPWLLEYGHGWAPYGWTDWFEVPPGTGINSITHGLAVNSGYNAYLAGYVEVYWYYGAKDGNYVFTSAPASGFGSTVYDAYWCYVP